MEGKEGGENTNRAAGEEGRKYKTQIHKELDDEEEEEKEEKGKRRKRMRVRMMTIMMIRRKRRETLLREKMEKREAE